MPNHHIPLQEELLKISGLSASQEAAITFICDTYFSKLSHQDSLEQLIEECGTEGDKPIFKSLSLHSLRPNSKYCQAPEGNVDMEKNGRWCARARVGIKVTDSKQWEKKVAWGHTPKEAVQNLLAALKTK